MLVFYLIMRKLFIVFVDGENELELEYLFVFIYGIRVVFFLCGFKKSFLVFF